MPRVTHFDQPFPEASVPELTVGDGWLTVGNAAGCAIVGCTPDDDVDLDAPPVWLKSWSAAQRKPMDPTAVSGSKSCLWTERAKNGSESQLPPRTTLCPTLL